MAKKNTKSAPVLLIENDPDVLANLRWRFQGSNGLMRGASGLEVDGATTVADAYDAVCQAGPHLQAVVVDIRLGESKNTNAKLQQELDSLDVAFFPDANETGYKLAALIRKLKPDLPIFGISSDTKAVSEPCKHWFLHYGVPTTNQPKREGLVNKNGVYHKTTEWALLRHHVLLSMGLNRTVDVFVVYGHDDKTLKLLEAKIKSLNWKPIIIGEEPRRSSSWFNMVQVHAETCDLAIVLYSADEWASGIIKPEATPERRPRPNVLLEHGYFLGKFGHDTSRVFFLYPPSVGIPSDIVNQGEIRMKPTFDETWQELLKELDPWLTASQRRKNP